MRTGRSETEIPESGEKRKHRKNAKPAQSLPERLLKESGAMVGLTKSWRQERLWRSIQKATETGSYGGLQLELNGERLTGT